MKIFAFIFSFYLLGISVLPCSDAHNECNNSKPTTEFSQNHDHRKDLNDFCSPFCYCNCCNTATTYAAVHTATEPRAAIYHQHNFFSPDFIFVSDYNGNIWQPPKTHA